MKNVMLAVVFLMSIGGAAYAAACCDVGPCCDMPMPCCD